MENEYIGQINEILEKNAIDKRAKELIKLYFIGKIKAGKITMPELEKQIDTLCSRIPKVEFTTGNLVSAYSNELGILTLNKRLLQEGKADELIVPAFMKFESILNQQNRRTFANNIEDLIQAGQIAKACSAPISDRLHKLYEIAQYTYGDVEDKINKLSDDGVWRGVCAEYNRGLNNIIITGSSDFKQILKALNIFHGVIYTPENIQAPNFIGPFNNPEYQQKAATIINAISNSNIEKNEQLENMIARIKLFTGCTDEMIDKAKEQRYTGDNRISEILKTTIETSKTHLDEELIVSKVQELLDKKPEWDSRIKHLVIPFFIRSQKIYNWDLDQFQERLNQVDLKIKEIKFEKFENDTIMGRTAGDKIELNEKVFFDKKGNPAYPVAPTIFHELGHITDENEREGVYSRERLENTPIIDTNFYEWTNTIFERAVSGVSLYKKNDAMELTEQSYQALAPLGSMVASALGVSELEFAHIKDKGKEYEDKLIESIFPNGEAKESLERIRNNFNKYELDTFFSFGKKKENQRLANEIYIECLNLMKKRIDIDTKRTTIDEQYIKRQKFLLKKLNYNFKKASKTDGFRFAMAKIVHDIGFCSDSMPKREMLEVAKEYTEMANFGFDNRDLGKYAKIIISEERRQAFTRELQDIKQEQVEKSTIEPTRRAEPDLDDYE